MKSSQPAKAVLFDHDGTVVNSEIIALKSAWILTAEVVAEFPGAQLYDLPEFIQSFAGMPYREILLQLYQNSPAGPGESVLSEKDIERLVIEEEDRAIAQLAKEAEATEGTPEVLDDLRDRNLEFALVSNSSLRRLSVCLAAANLNAYFLSDRIFSAHDSLPAPAPKPLPDVYLYAAKSLGVEASNCVAVEDSISGVRSAIAAKIPQVIGYIGGTHITEAERANRALVLQSAGAHHIIEQMPDLLPLLSTEAAVH
jgi:HAD superfamily hydrolase (TIGR01509 family)